MPSPVVGITSTLQHLWPSASEIMGTLVKLQTFSQHESLILTLAAEFAVFRRAS